MKRIVSIQDISCVGKCSLTVALPIISAMGVETSIVPTAVLSTHTMFKGFTFRDLTDDMLPILEHWKKEGFKFDAIYTGYLGSLRQIDIVKEYFDSLKGENTAIIVDPAMADNGKLYVGFDEAFAKEMLNLCTKADITLPNISEAALMLGEEYPGEEANEDVVRGLLTKLVNAGCKFPVITGVTLDNGSFGFIGLNGENGEFISYGTTKVPYKSHGTGDVYASAFTGALTLGKSVHTALKIATDFTAASIRNTYEDPDSVNYAVNFEAEIPYLLNLLKEN
ncbi:pyridoxine kinase [Butyrivibrio fibrisolvens]|uniref:pyridoxal kinase n=1 Tax=Butyrivibrio fibrisolvens TaxID=831 RepID=A0A1H9MGM7_BUTFI|nr:pyridoxamine kinase [Butyrivibrio fibrisolvens]SER22627.1 pyridoxine kinase [Butyrivibrio fibrisolvens]